MKKQAIGIWGVILTLLLLFAGSQPVWAKLYDSDCDLVGIIVKINVSEDYFIFEYGPTHKPKVFFCDELTNFRDGDKSIKLKDLYVGNRVRVWFVKKLASSHIDKNVGRHGLRDGSDRGTALRVVLVKESLTLISN